MALAPPPHGEPSTAVVPARAAGVELLGELAHSGYEHAPQLVRRADGQMLQLTPLLSAVLAAIDGHRDLASVAREASATTGKALSADDIAYLIDEKLRPLGVVRDADGAEPEVEKANPLLALRWRVVVSNPETTRAITRPFVWLFRPPVIAATLVAFVATVGWVLFGRGLGGGLRSMFFDPKQLVLVYVLTALSAGFHEFGHAAACRYGGATPGAMGAGLYLVWPAFYTDVTDSYRLDRRGRLRTDLGGLYFNCIFTVAMVATAVVTGAESLLVLVPLQLLQMVHQLLPVLRLDGYHILADLTGVPDLYARIRPTLRSAIPGRATDERAAALRPGVRRAVTAWVAVIVPVLILSIGSAALAMPRLLATAAASVVVHWRGLQEAWTNGEVFGVLAGMLSIVAVVIPVAGSIYIVQRIVGRIWRYTWNRFDSPAAHQLQTAVAAIVVLALLISWWPNGDYRPIQRGETLTVQELPVVRALSTRSAVPLLGEAPSTDLRRVAAPTGAGTEGAPGRAVGRVVEGDDNLALAVNTADGASIFRLAFTIRSIAHGAVDQTNAAVALASCRSCSTIALAFQVLLVFGSAEQVTPENRATAVNVLCQACMTFAAATQIILTFDRPVELTEAGRRRLDELHRRLLALEEQAGSLDGDALAVIVAEAREELVQILEEELVPVDDSSPPPDDDAEAEGEAEGDDEGTSTSSTTTSSTTSSTSTTTSSTSTTSTTVAG